MKSFVAIAVLTIAASSLAFGDAKDKATAQSGKVEQTLMHIEQEMLDAMLKGDASLNERYLADTFVFTAPDGEVSDKARAVADLKTGALKFQSSKLDNMKVRVYGDTAVVTYGSTDKGSYKGKDISGRFRWTDVFVNRNGHWQIVSGQGTPIAAK